MFDSSIDMILRSPNHHSQEKVETIICQSLFPEVDSHHDIILSSVSIPVSPSPPSQDNLKSAPRISNVRTKIVWSEDKIPDYQASVSTRLRRLRNDWFIPDSSASVSILLTLTHKVLGQAAAATNKSISLSSTPTAKSLKIPPEVFKASQNMKKAHTAYKEALRSKSNDINTTKDVLKSAKKAHRLAVRRQNHKEDLARDIKLHSVLTQNPSALFRALKTSKSSSAGSVPFITVGDKKYVGPQVPDGLFDSIASLKS